MAPGFARERRARTFDGRLYSDYRPSGQTSFGGMFCSRYIKDECSRVASKAEFRAVHGQHERFVQETCLCRQFVRRVPGTGYRG